MYGWRMMASTVPGGMFLDKRTTNICNYRERSAVRVGKVIAANQQDAVPPIRQEVVVEIPQIPVGETADTDVEQASARAENAVHVVCGTD
jgi:hypothetical protein